VKVVIEQYIGIHSDFVPQRLFEPQAVKHFAIGIVQHDGLAIVTPLNHMMRVTWKG
jgi:hypothetical protein